jgi:hypothetical protein
MKHQITKTKRTQFVTGVTLALKTAVVGMAPPSVEAFRQTALVKREFRLARYGPTLVHLSTFTVLPAQPAWPSAHLRSDRLSGRNQSFTAL